MGGQIFREKCYNRKYKVNERRLTTKEYKLPDLPYDYSALEPYFDEETMRLHHDKHHATYVANLNAAVAKYPDFLANFTADDASDVLIDLDAVPDEIRETVRNNGGGHANHSFFWEILKPANDDTISQPTGKLADEIRETFGSFDEFREKFADAAKSCFGSGWAWLVVNNMGDLEIVSTANQDSPLSDGKTPILALDVWEHAYYLKYRNVRPDYIDAFWHLVDWEKVAENFAKLLD